MAKKRSLILIVLCFGFGVSISAAAEKTCFAADGDSGELNFRGEVEGTAFSGFFEDFSVRVCMEDERLETAEIEVTVKMAAATVGNRQGDEALRGRDMFAVDRFPEASWRSADVEAANGAYRANGQLSIRDISAEQPVNLRLERDGEQLWLSGDAEIMRLDFNVGLGEFEDPDFVRNRIDLRFELQLTPSD